jgi:polyphosphate kinase
MRPAEPAPAGGLNSNEPKEVASAAAPVAAASSEAPAGPPALTLESPELYINRELSSLEFQKRVLEQAEDPENPLLERVKFLSIVSSNLDEFFMVRVAGLQREATSGAQEASVDGLPAAIQLQLIRQEVRRLVEHIQHLLRDTLLPALEREGIRISEISSLPAEERSAMDSYFHQNVFPVLTPLAFDPGRPFPHISSGSLNLAVVVGDNQGTENFARVKVPDSLPRLVPVMSNTRKAKTSKGAKSERTFVWLEQLITANPHSLFPGMEIVESHPFRVTRDAEVAIQELESDDLLESVEEAMKLRRFSSVVRLQVDANVSEKILEILASNLPIDKQDVYRISGSMGLGRLMELYALDRPDLKDKPFLPSIPPSLGADADEDVFSAIRGEDLLPTLAIDSPTIWNCIAIPARHFYFSVCGGAGGHVNHDRWLFLTGERDGDGVGAEHALSTPQGGN